MKNDNVKLRILSKTLAWMTLGLIFLGGLVKSTESGLSVPDWPTTYGHFMFSYPLDQMAGGIKFEHTHRMLASIVGLVALIQAILLLRSSVPVWLKRLGIWSVVTVIFQGVLGGLTVKYFLPVWLSSFHGVLAQSFFLITVMIAYGLSIEHQRRHAIDVSFYDPKLMRGLRIFLIMVFVQLILGNLMRHTESGLAIPDFPTMGGALFPSMNAKMLAWINAWRFEHNLEPVKMGQVHIHLTHRVWALLIFLKLIYLNQMVFKKHLQNPLIIKTIFWLNIAVFIQIVLGIGTVVSGKEVLTTTLHVAVGAVVLALSFFLLLRSSPVSFEKYRTLMKQR